MDFLEYSVEKFKEFTELQGIVHNRIYYKFLIIIQRKELAEIVKQKEENAKDLELFTDYAKEQEKLMESLMSSKSEMEDIFLQTRAVAEFRELMQLELSIARQMEALERINARKDYLQKKDDKFEEKLRKSVFEIASILEDNEITEQELKEFKEREHKRVSDRKFAEALQLKHDITDLQERLAQKRRAHQEAKLNLIRVQNENKTRRLLGLDFSELEGISLSFRSLGK